MVIRLEELCLFYEILEAIRLEGSDADNPSAYRKLYAINL